MWNGEREVERMQETGRGIDDVRDRVHHAHRGRDHPTGAARHAPDAGRAGIVE